MAYSILCNDPKNLNDTYLLYGKYNDFAQAERGELKLQNHAVQNNNNTDFKIIFVCDANTESSGHIWKELTKDTREFWTGKWEPIEK